MPSPTALYTVAEIRAIEHAAIASLPAGTLMQRAGRAAGHMALNLISEPANIASVLILAGPGNNGGDALETAHLLADTGLRVTVVLCANTDRQSSDALQALARAKDSPIHFIELADSSVPLPANWDLIIDGLFGIGLTRPISDHLYKLIETVNTFTCPILALDVPSGLDADTGSIVGDGGIAIRASHTITFIGDKPGLHTCEGRDYAGEVKVADLEIDANHFQSTKMHLNSLDAFANFLRLRRHNSHKGSYGDAIVIGGAHGMAGAPILAARAAAKCGAGRVFAAFIESPVAYDSMHPELMCRYARDMNFSSGTLVVGPGLGLSREAYDVLAKALLAPGSLVLDADALNLIAAEPALQQSLAQRKKSTIMTPHPLEAARLLRTSAKNVQANRLESARKLARQFNATVILKGSGSVIANPDGELMVNTTGNPALATAGTGDVLAGMCGALMAQSFPAWNAALAATWLHGQAADTLVSQEVGPIGLVASELIPIARTILNQVTQLRGKQIKG